MTNEKDTMLGGLHMTPSFFPTIDMQATGENIIRLRKAHGLSVRELQHYFGFEEPQAIYKWQQGKSLPSVDNLFALSQLLGVSMNEILVQTPQLNLTGNGQSSDCPFHRFINFSDRFRRNRIPNFQPICSLCQSRGFDAGCCFYHLHFNSKTRLAK